MFTIDKRFRRRVSFGHQKGSFVARIARNNERLLYVLMLTAFTAGFLLFCVIFVRAFLKHFTFTDFLYALPFIAFCCVWYTMGLRLTLWRLFGVEEIVVQGTVLHWTRTAWIWKRNVDIPIGDIRQVKAVTPWHGLTNRVELATDRRTHTVGDMLLRDETIDLAHKLKHRIGLTG